MLLMLFGYSAFYIRNYLLESKYVIFSRKRICSFWENSTRNGKYLWQAHIRTKEL